MFQSAIEASQKSWFTYEPFTLLSIYKSFQRKFIEVYAPYQNVIERYRDVTKSEVYPITEEYLSDKKVAEENVVLLKNAIELWRSAAQTTDQIAPLLFHYSWHCFNSFFTYTFFRWEPQHANSHGIETPSDFITDDVKRIKLSFGKNKNNRIERGMFQRLIDTWILLGCEPAFGEFFPVFEQNNTIDFLPNEWWLLKDSKCLELSKLMDFDPHEFTRRYWQTFGRDKLIKNDSFSNSMGLPTNVLKDYLILFAASSIARYRPILWSSVLSGETSDKSEFALKYRNALLTFSQFGANSNRFLYQLGNFMFDVMKGKFEFKHLS